MASTETTHDDLARRLEELGETDHFDPPKSFVAQAMDTGDSLWKEAAKDPVAWWADQAKDLHWFSEWDTVLDDSNAPFYTWFDGGTINASYNCLDRHVDNGLGERVAIHWRGEEGEERDVTYGWLHEQVQRFANVLKDSGVQAGDVVGIFMPMIPEVVVAMLACARIGAPHNVVFGGFSPESVRERMETSEAKALVTVDGARRKGKTAPIKPAVDEVMGDVASIEKIFVVKATGTDCEMQEGRDVWWHEAMEAASPECPAEELDAEHPLFILYSSGSTNKPKGILHSTGGYLTGVAWTTKHVFDLKPDSDVYWCAADVGWITGHSYIVYGPLLNGITQVMYEGPPDYPAKDVHWKLIEELGVTIYYFAPTAIRSFMKWGAELPAKHDLSSLRLLGTVGEPINPKAWLWYREVIGLGETPVVDTWWQTETGAHHDHDAARSAVHAAGVGGHAAAGRGGEDPRRVIRGGGRGQQAGAARADEAMARDAAHALRGQGALRRDVLPALRTGGLPRRRRGADRHRRLLLDHRAHRRRAQRVRAPDVDRRDRVGDRVATTSSPRRR